jgi:hypothetical protein
MPDYQTKKGKISSKKPIPKISQKLLGIKNIKKKPVQKKKKGGGIGKLASILSPAYGIMKGQGPFSSLASGIAKAAGPLAGPVALLAKDKREEAKKRRMAMAGANKMTSSAIPQTNRMTPMTQMMAGGPVKRKRSIDGCAMKGKTRAI